MISQKLKTSISVVFSFFLSQIYKTSKMRKTLIINIESFLQESIRNNNEGKHFEKLKFFEIVTGISYLTVNNFDSKEKFQYFLNYYNQPNRRMEKHLIENGITNNNLEGGNFLRMCNYLHGIKNWMK